MVAEEGSSARDEAASVSSQSTFTIEEEMSRLKQLLGKKTARDDVSLSQLSPGDPEIDLHHLASHAYDP